MVNPCDANVYPSIPLLYVPQVLHNELFMQDESWPIHYTLLLLILWWPTHTLCFWLGTLSYDVAGMQAWPAVKPLLMDGWIPVPEHMTLIPDTKDNIIGETDTFLSM